MKELEGHEAVTVLVFKDNHASRTFNLPLAWVSRFGTILGIAILLTVGSIALAVRTHIETRRAAPARLRELEQEIVDLRSQLAQAVAAKGPSTTAVAVAPPANTADSQIPAQPAPAAPQTATIATTVPGVPVLVKTAPIPDPASLSFKISEPKASWKGKYLQVRFGIQYTRTDGGNQQGKIVIIAKGAQTLLSYPSGTLSGTGESLLDANKGEFFSVRAFRATAADFGPLAVGQNVESVQAMIFDQNGQLILIENIPLLGPTKP